VLTLKVDPSSPEIQNGDTILNVDVDLVDCNAIQTCRQVPEFRKNILPVSALKMEAVCSSRTLVCTCKFTRRYNPEDRYRHIRRCEHLKSRNYKPLKGRGHLKNLGGQRTASQ
jgi:hypothetical protein